MLRVSPKGGRSYVLRYTSPIDSKQRRFTLGSVEAMSAKRARELAAQVIDGLRNGVDPQQDKIEQQGIWTCAELLDKYEEELQRRVDRAASDLKHQRGHIRRTIRPLPGHTRVTDMDKLSKTLVMPSSAILSGQLKID